MTTVGKLALVSLLSQAIVSLQYAAAAEVTKTLPAGTRLYLTLDKQVTSKRGETDVGETVPCRVWRDVESEGTMFIKGGTLAGCRVDKIKRSNMGGVQGKVSVAGLETKSVDGQAVMLSGGYNKEGSGRKAVVWTVGLLLLWPVLFVPGGAAELPPGTVFDVSTVSDVQITLPAISQHLARLDLSSISGGLSGEVLLDEFLQQEKPVILKIRVRDEAPFPTTLFIDSVNGKSIDQLPLKTGEVTSIDGMEEAVCETQVKPLAKHFQKGINRFEIAETKGGERVSTEVILDVQM